MIQLFKNIENYKELSLHDMAVVAQKYDFFIPEHKAQEYSKKAIPLVKEAFIKVRKYLLSSFDKERKELSSIIEKYFDKEYFESQREYLEEDMIDTNYLLKGYLQKMNINQLNNFGMSLIMGYRRLGLFMTEDNFDNFAWDIGVETNQTMKGDAFLMMHTILKERLIEIYLKYINLNVILADDIAEEALRNATFQELLDYIIKIDKMKYKNLYKEIILM